MGELQFSLIVPLFKCKFNIFLNSIFIFLFFLKGLLILNYIYSIHIRVYRVKKKNMFLHAPLTMAVSDGSQAN